MPPRVVTSDLESMLGVEVLSVVGVPYRDAPGLPMGLSGGIHLDILVRLPAGTVDGGDLHPHAFEALSSAPGQLKRDDGGPLHEIWGWPRRVAPLDPDVDEDATTIASERLATLSVDLGRALGARVERARPIARGDGRVVPEVLVDSPGNSANRPSDHIYDTLDAHPSELRAVVERSPWARRETEQDEPPGWEQRKPGPGQQP